MKIKLYILISILFAFAHSSMAQFIDYIPLQNNNSYNKEREIVIPNSLHDDFKISSDYDFYRAIKESEARRAAQPTVISEELLSVTGLNIMKELEVKAKISQRTYSNGDVMLYLTGLKYDDAWIPIKEVVVSKLSILIQQATRENEEDAKQVLLELSEFANYLTIINDEYIIF